MGIETKPLSRSKNEAIRKWPCDGEVRFTPKGRRVLMNYSDAYDAILLDSGGSIEEKGDKTNRTHTGESIRRLSALNLLYLGRPSSREFIQGEHVKAVLSQQAAEEAEKAKTPVETPST